MLWFGHFTEFCPFGIVEEEMVHPDATTRSTTSGTVYSIGSEETPIPPTQIHLIYMHGRSGDGPVQQKVCMDQET